MSRAVSSELWSNADLNENGVHYTWRTLISTGLTLFTRRYNMWILDRNSLAIMRIQIYIGVTVLILTQKCASEAVSLPSPVNMSIQCDSYGVEVRWEYPDLSRDVQFQVEVNNDFNERNSTITRNLHLNISSMLLNASFNRYYVKVMAVRGGEKSEPAKSDSFSYNKYATTYIKCYLDFPEVELSPKDGKLHVQFTNPLQLYRNSPALRGLTNHLEYCLETEEENEVCETCKMTQNTCETSIVFSNHSGEYCVNLTGNTGQRFFNLRSSCFTGDIRSYPPVTVYVYPVLGVVLTLLFITVVIMLLAKKFNSEMKRKVLSMFQHFFVFPSHPPTPLKMELEKMEPHLQIEPPEDKEQTTLIPLSDDDEDLGSSDSEDNRFYGPNDLVEDELGNYDCPHAPRQIQEMSPGDTVDGYGPKLLLEV